MNKDQNSTISPEQLKDALQRSGYLVESRIDSLLRRRGYYVTPNVCYLDSITGKAREIDLHALQAFRAGKGKIDFVWSLCLIECVNSSQPIAFFTKPDSVAFLRRESIQVAGFPVRLIKGRNTWIDVPEAMAMDKYHHYCRGRIATQFCSFSTKKGNPPEWFAQHLPDHFASFTKLLDAIRDSSNELADRWYDAGDVSYEYLNLQFIYPIIVVSGAPLYDVVQRKGGLDVHAKSHFLYKASGVAHQKVVEYFVDVVTEAAFPRFISMIKHEMNTTAELLQQRSAMVKNSLRRIYNIAKRVRSTDKMRFLTQLPSPHDPKSL